MTKSTFTFSRPRLLVLCALLSALTAIGAFIKIPVPPTPISLQFLFTAMAGCLLGAKWGAISQLIYVLIGLIGIPVFTSGGGIMYVFHPTFGFLVGFIASAFVIGLLRGRLGYSFSALFVSVLAGVLVLYLIGIPYLYIILRFYMRSDTGFLSVVWSSMVVFLPGDIIKTAVAAFVCSKAILRLRLSA